MSIINRREIQVERKTYLCGRFVAKLNGDIDYEKSDLIRENFFSLEYLSADIFANFSDLKRWQDGGENEEFAAAKRFFPEIQNPIDCHLTYDDGTVKHFTVDLFEPKLNAITLDKQVYEKGVVFVTLNAQICGYLRHFETEVIEEVVEEPIPDSTLGDPILAKEGVRNIDADTIDPGEDPTTDHNGAIVSTSPQDAHQYTQALTNPIVAPFEPHTVVGRMFKSVMASGPWSTIRATKHSAAQYFPRTANWLGNQYYGRRPERIARGCAANAFATPLSGCFFTLLGAIVLMYLVIGVWMILFSLLRTPLALAGTALAEIAIYLLLFCALYFALKKTGGFGAWMIRIIILLLIVGMISRC